jgi:hypothetical protein
MRRFREFLANTVRIRQTKGLFPDDARGDRTVLDLARRRPRPSTEQDLTQRTDTGVNR